MANLRGIVLAVVLLVTGPVLAGCGGETAASDPTTTTDAPTTTTELDPEKKAVGETIEIESMLEEDDESRATADALLADAVDAVERHGWSDLAVATAAGFVPMFGEPDHWVNRANVLDGVSWDVDRPEFLVVFDGELLGLMFSAPDPGLDQPPPPGSPLVRWHYHRWGNPVCLENGIITVAVPDAAGACPPGTVASPQSSLMAHVWTVEETDDPFATDMSAHQH